MNLNLEIQRNLERINSIESKFHRDLVAFLYSPFVFESFFSKELIFSADEFKNFEQLLDWSNGLQFKEVSPNLERLRLGKYTEALVEFYFKNSNKYDLLGANLQLIVEKITISEIDYLLKRKNDDYAIHLELAIKFFLKTEMNGKVEWIGPSTKDNLSKKQSKLINKQLKLTKTHSYLMPEQFQKIDFQPQLLLKGAAFLPFNEYSIQENPLQNAWWLHVENLNHLNKQTYLYGIIPNRKDWIFPFNKRLGQIKFETLAEQINDYLLLQNEIMIARFSIDGEAIDRGFVVRSHWPLTEKQVTTVE